MTEYIYIIYTSSKESIPVGRNESIRPLPYIYVWGVCWGTVSVEVRSVYIVFGRGMEVGVVGRNSAQENNFSRSSIILTWDARGSFKVCRAVLVKGVCLSSAFYSLVVYLSVVWVLSQGVISPLRVAMTCRKMFLKKESQI